VGVGLIICAGVLAAATVFGLVRRRRGGVLHHVDGRGKQTRRGGALTAARLGRPLGARATLVQFSSAFCAPCRSTRRILADVAAMVDGVAHIEIDAESHLGLVRELGIVSTPTVLVLGADGAIARRATGQPRKADVIAALGSVVPAGVTGSPGLSGSAGPVGAG
jgi:thiol-disulfide isomerase/thioredoxin